MATLLIAGVTARPTRAALSWPNCKDLTDADFKVTTIAAHPVDSTAEPLKMAFDLVAQPGEDAADKVDVYYVERYGKLRKYDARQKKVITLGKIPNLNAAELAGSSDGLIGLALDPGFKTNHWIFLYYTFFSGTQISWHLSRFTLDAANQNLNLASEKILLNIPIHPGSLHASGAMEFDAYGDLWVTVSNNMIDETGLDPYPVWSSGNTNDLRGKILRIHPNPDGSYSIPKDNLFPAGKYPANKTRPEIYVMGLRNPYTIDIDPVRRWLVWGDVGPNKINNPDGSPANVEEGNVATSPGNYGYPFFVGDKSVNLPGSNGVKPEMPIIPANANWNNTPQGLDTLPPARPAVHAYHESLVITGPIYRYDGDLNSSIKFPPHFNRKWLLTDFKAKAGNPVVAVTLSDDGLTETAVDTVLKKVALYSPLGMKQGPDGAIYFINYAGYRTVTNNTGIIRVDYIGDCRPAEPKLERPTALARSQSPRGDMRLGLFQAHGLISAAIVADGAFSLRVSDVKGRPVALRSGSGNAQVTLDEIRRPGIYFFSLKTPAGRLVRKLVRE